MQNFSLSFKTGRSNNIGPTFLGGNSLLHYVIGTHEGGHRLSRAPRPPPGLSPIAFSLQVFAIEMLTWKGLCH